MPEKRIPLEDLLRVIGEEAAATEVDAYLVGGFVRDRLLGRPGKDIDIVAVGSDGIPLIAALSRRLGWSAPVVFERFGTGQTTGDGYVVEIVRARAESYAADSRNPEVRPGSLEEDIMRRDFTVNALCQRFDGDVIDITGRGMDDLAARILRTPLEPARTFSDDPLRMFRCARFVAQLGFGVAPEILPAMRAEAQRTTILSVERITEELRRLLTSQHPRAGLEMLRDGGLLPHVLPELQAMVGVEQGGYHLYDVFEHTARAVEDTPPDLVTRTAALFHDIGKPSTHVVAEGGKHTFYDHPAVGARMARGVLERMRFSNDEIDAVARIVELHLRPIQYEESWSDTAVRRLIRDAGTLRARLLDVARADTRASSYPDTNGIDQLERRMTQLDDGGRIAQLKPPLSGHQIMAEAGGRASGPWIGEVQRALVEAVLCGEVPPSDGEAALAWLRAHRELFPS